LLPAKDVVRLSGRYLKETETALAHRSAILSKHPKDEGTTKPFVPEDKPFGEDVKMISQHKLQCRLLTPMEQDEAIEKYQSGLNMTEVANIYGCHYTTIGRLLRARKVKIRD
jgi:hypothetical protein